MSVDVDVAVVGGGVVGCAVARILADRFERVFLFERNQGITRGDNQSSRNSGVVHAGIYYDRETRPLKARLCVEGNRLLYDFCERHGVPVLRTGKLVVACEPAEERVLDFYTAFERRRTASAECGSCPRGKSGKWSPTFAAAEPYSFPLPGSWSQPLWFASWRRRRRTRVHTFSRERPWRRWNTGMVCCSSICVDETGVWSD